MIKIAPFVKENKNDTGLQKANEILDMLAISPNIAQEMPLVLSLYSKYNQGY